MNQTMRILVALTIGLLVSVTPALAASVNRNVRASSRTSVNADFNRNTNVNVNRNTNVNVNRNIDVDVDVDRRHHPVATAVVATAVVGSIIYSLPPACSVGVVNGVTFQQCGGTWYQPRFSGTTTTYVVVTAPR